MIYMRTTLILPEDVLRQAMDLSKARTKTEAVVLSLRTFVRLKLRESLAKAGGSLKSLASTREIVRGRRKR